MAVLRAGLTLVNTNPLYTARELRHQLTDSGAAAIIVLENFAHTLADVIGETSCKHVIVAALGDMLGFPKRAITNFVVRKVKKLVPPYTLAGAVRFSDALRSGAREVAPKIEIDGEDIAFLQYTGGTTGVAKGAMLTHRNMVANMLQALAWIRPNIREGEEVVVTALPLYHIFALTANMLVFARVGGYNHLITNPRDMPAFVKAIAKIRFTALTGVNTLFAGLLNTPGFDKVDFSRLHLTLGGGMAVQRAVADRWKKVTGCAVAEAYGLTETAPAVCINPLDIPDYTGSIGLPIPSTEVSIQDEDGKVLPIGEIGELCVRGPQVMKGYWQRADETAKVLAPDGWLRTGDIARIDEKGYVYIVDRKKDMILVSGFNVYPNEIEDVDRAGAGRARSRRGRRAGREIGRGGQGRHRAQGSRAHRRGYPRALPRQPDRLQAAQVHRVPRFAAEDECRQDPAARAARARVERRGGGKSGDPDWAIRRPPRDPDFQCGKYSSRSA